jgi:hypothetical protein
MADVFETHKPMKQAQDAVHLLRFVLGIFAGMLVAYGLVEAIELGLIVALNGSIPQDSEQYFAIRNRPAMLLAKVFYTILAGLVAGYVTAWIAERVGLLAGVVLALIQAAGFIWAMMSSNPLFAATPTWMWIVLLATMPEAMLVGAWLRARRYTPHPGIG